jgi:hypothetical protein
VFAWALNAADCLWEQVQVTACNELSARDTQQG